MEGKTPGAKMVHIGDGEQQREQLKDQHIHRQVQWQDDDESPKPPGPTGFEAVTPGIHIGTYIHSDPDDQDYDSESPSSSNHHPEDQNDGNGENQTQDPQDPSSAQDQGRGSYFPAPRRESRSEASRSRRRSRQQMGLNNADVGDNGDLNGHGNPRVNAMRRRESLSEIRAANPDLALSGNIISATFNTPHSFKYRKGGDWVRNSNS